MRPFFRKTWPVSPAGILRQLPCVPFKQISSVRRLFRFPGLVMLLTSCAMLVAQLTQVNRISTITGNGVQGDSGDSSRATGEYLIATSRQTHHKGRGETSTNHFLHSDLAAQPKRDNFPGNTLHHRTFRIVALTSE